MPDESVESVLRGYLRRLGRDLTSFSAGGRCKFCACPIWDYHASDCPWRLAMEASMEPDEGSKPKPRKRRWFVRHLVSLLKQPIEDGVTHPAEAEVRNWLQADRSSACDWIGRAISESGGFMPSTGASLVRIVGRLDFDLVGRWGLRIADEALQHRDVEVREAAVRALEAWGGSDAMDILRPHVDEDSSLHGYIRQVIRDSSEPEHVPDATEKVEEATALDLAAAEKRMYCDPMRFLADDAEALFAEVRRHEKQATRLRRRLAAKSRTIDEQAATIAKLEKAIEGWEETAEILADPEMMKQLCRGLEDVRAGRLVDHDECALDVPRP